MSATQANAAEFQDGGKPVAPPVYQVDATGHPLTAPAAQSGYVSPASNQSAMTASTDYTFTWAQQVNHVMLQNNSGANINWDLDVATTAGSPILASGQTLFLDVQTTVLHLQSGGTPNVNGSSSGNVVVRGWL